MYNMNFLEDLFSGVLGVIILLVIAVIVYRKAGKGGLASLALTKFSFNPEAVDFLIIEGRKTGLWQWILVQLKLGNRFRIQVNKEQISYSEDSARGNTLVLTPLAKIASTSGGYGKPIGLLIAAAILLLAGIVLLFSQTLWGVLSILLAGILTVYYVYKKDLFIGIQPVSGNLFGFSFKKSFIENINVDIEIVRKSIAYLNEKVIEANKQ